MVLAQLLRQSIFILLIEIEVGFLQNRVLLYYLVKDIDIERQSLSTFQLLN